GAVGVDFSPRWGNNHAMRPLAHIGLALTLVVAPALCCCSARWVSAPAAQPTTRAACPSCPTSDHPKTQPVRTCCHAELPNADPQAPATPVQRGAPPCCAHHRAE